MEVKIGKVGQIGKFRKLTGQGGVRTMRKLCKSLTKGLARRNREKHAISAEVEEEELEVKMH